MELPAQVDIVHADDLAAVDVDDLAVQQVLAQEDEVFVALQRIERGVRPEFQRAAGRPANVFETRQFRGPCGFSAPARQRGPLLRRCRPRRPGDGPRIRPRTLVMGVPRMAVSDRNATSSVMTRSRHECNSLFFRVAGESSCDRDLRQRIDAAAAERAKLRNAGVEIREACRRFSLTGQRYGHTLSAGRVGGSTSANAAAANERLRLPMSSGTTRYAPQSDRVKLVVASSVMLTFISFWRAAAVVLNDLGSSAFYAGGIAEQAVGKAAPWFILGVMLFSFAVRSVYVESCSMFTRGGVYRVVKEALGGNFAKLSVSALMFDYILTGPISGVSAGQYIVGLLNELLGVGAAHGWLPSAADGLAAPRASP